MNRLRELREALGLSSDELATRVGTTGSQIRRLEAGTRRLTIDWMDRIAEALECSPSDLMVHAVATAVTDEVEVSTMGHTGVGNAIAGSGLATYRVCGTSLTAIGIHPGDIITVDESQEACASLSDGDIVMVQLMSPRVLLLRQFARPGLLHTNTEGANLAIRTNDRSIALQIVGVVVRN